MILILLVISKFSFAQDDLINTFYHHFDVRDEKRSYREYTSDENEIKQVASVLFILYKEFISSQDIDACVFTPSCSVYAVESINTYGFFKGIANASDRIMRCHPFSSKYYHTHPHTGKNYDPIEEEK